MSLRVIANLVLAVVLGSVTAQAQEMRMGQTSRATIVLAQAWWTVAGQTKGSAAGAAFCAEQTHAAPPIIATHYSRSIPVFQ